MSERLLQEPGVLGDDAASAKLLRLLDSDPARAGERYRLTFQKLVRLFAAHLCRDPEDLAGETILRACRAIDGGLELTSQFETFLFGVAKNIALEDYKRRRKEHLPLEEMTAAHEPALDPLDDALGLPKWKQDLYHECLRRCLQNLDEQQRDELIQFYRGDQEGELKSNRKQLDLRLGTNTKALGSRMLRLRARLDLCIKECVERSRQS